MATGKAPPAMRVMKNNTGVRITTAGGIGNLVDALNELADMEVLVGYPEDGTAREDATEPTNAELAYIHDNGAPEAKIPQRSFMVPGIEAAMPAIEKGLTDTLKAVLRTQDTSKVDAGLTRVGFAAANSIKRTINAGVPPPLSERTLKKRLQSGRKGGAGARKGAALELAARAAGKVAGTEFAKPLVDTAQLRNAATFVVGSRKKRAAKGD